MKILIHLCLVMFTSALFANPTDSPSTKVDFIDGSLSLAIQKAGQEGKLLFVEFGAKWCMPCRFMDENTFKDGEVVSYMAENYVPVKIDIDDFDGFVYKEKYKVESLPTFLIFNSEGKVIERYEQSMAPSNLLNVLKEHNQDRHRPQVATQLSAYEIEAQLHEMQKSRVNVSPYEAADVVVTQTESTVPESIIAEPTIAEPVVSTESIENQISDQPIIETRFDETPIVQDLKEKVVVETTGELLWDDEETEDVYNMEETTPEYNDVVTTTAVELLENATPSIIFYTIRVGNFANKQSMDEYVRATSAIFIEDTHIFESNSDGIESFEVCLGSFASETSASKFVDKLGFLNIRGEIKTVKQ